MIWQTSSRRRRVRRGLARALVAGGCVGLALATAPAVALTISGHVSGAGSNGANVQIAGAKATCSAVDANGNYTCTVPSNWTGTLAAFSPGLTFSPPSYSYAGLNTNAAGADFTATAAMGVNAEIGVFRGGWFLLDFDRNSVVDLPKPFGGSVEVALAGDRNGDGMSDFALYRNGTWYINYHQTDLHQSVDEVFNFGGGPPHRPLLVDIDGDGRADPVVFRDGFWYVYPNGNPRYFFGGPGDIPIAGDFNGDGIIDLGVFRNGIWYISTSRTTNIFGAGQQLVADLVIGFGSSGDIPVPADYDGDGRTDLAVFRNGVWQVSTRLDSVANLVFYLGDAGDVPVAGYFNFANTKFVNAGGSCTTGCTQINPYRTIFSAWEEASDGQTIRIAPGTYNESLHFTAPGNQYAPGRYGKNNIKLIGVSRTGTVIAPSSGDALELQGAAGYTVRNMRLSAQGSGARGLLLSGGPGSYIPGFPGAHGSFAQLDIVENDGPNVLLIGSANAWFRYTRASRSRRDSGVLLEHFAYTRFVSGEANNNGYTLALPPIPDSPIAGRGFDVRADSEADVRRTVIAGNISMGVIGTGGAKTSISLSSIGQNYYNGLLFCGANPNDTSTSVLTSNWIAGNGLSDPQGNYGYNGVELYVTCVGSHQITGNTFIANTYNGLFAGSGTLTATGNAFISNKIGMTLYASDAMSSTNTSASLYGNLFQANKVQGLWAERDPGSTARQVIATVGGAGGLKNTFRDHIGPGVWGISCPTNPSAAPTSLFACPAGGNVFINNTGNVAPTCPASCTQ